MTCDVVVVGNELCGLAAAALIASLPGGGKRVVVLDDSDPCYALPLGDRFAPTVPCLVRLAHGGPVGAMLDALGIKQDARRVLGEPGGLGLIDDPDIRMIVPVDADARARELARVFGADEGSRAAVRIHDVTADGRAGLLAEAPLIHEDGFFEKRRMKKRIEMLGAAGRLDEDDAIPQLLATFGLGAAAERLVPFVQGRPAAKSTGSAGLLAALQLQAGAHGASKGGLGPRAALAELLGDIIRRHRGEVQRAKVESVEADGKNLTIVKATGANDYAARVVIDATSRRDLAMRIPEGRRREKLLEQEKRVQPAGDVACVRWLLPSSSLPRGMPPVALVLRENTLTPGSANGVLVGVYAGAPLKEGHASSKKGAGGLDESLVVVTAAAACKHGEADACAVMVEDVLDRLLPFAKDTRKAHDVLAGGAARPAMPLWVVVDSEHPLEGRRPQTAFANFLRAGRDLVPGLGIEGELLAARSVATEATAILGAGKRSDAA